MPDEKGGSAQPAAPPSYVARLGEASKWATGALAAVAGTAVTKLGLDRLGTGEVDTALVRWAYAGLVLFALGVVAIIAATVWHERAARVTLGYLLSKGRVAKKIEAFFDENTYFLGGAPTLRAFREEMNDLVGQLKERKLTTEERRRLDQLLASRSSIIETGARERMRNVSRWAAVMLGVGALCATLGAATFALTTNRDVTLREDRLAQEARDRQEIVTGTLLPRTPAEVRVDVPSSAEPEVTAAVGAACDLATLDGILVEVGAPPKEGAVPATGGRRNVFHVVTERDEGCDVGDLWLRPGWVTPRPAAADEPVEVEPE